jgi:cyanate lyase
MDTACMYDFVDCFDFLQDKALVFDDRSEVRTRENTLVFDDHSEARTQKNTLEFDEELVNLIVEYGSLRVLSKLPPINVQIYNLQEVGIKVLIELVQRGLITKEQIHEQYTKGDAESTINFLFR